MALEKKEDRRVRYTKKAIRDSFIALLEKKPLEKISVTEICKDADINRGTFYAHYKDPYDLKNKLIQELTDIIRNYTSEVSTRRITTVEALTLLKENSDLCRIFAGKNGDYNALLKFIWEHTSEHLNEYAPEIFENIPEIRAKGIKLMIVSSITALVKAWIDLDMIYSPESLAEILRTYVSFGVTGFRDTSLD